MSELFEAMGIRNNALHSRKSQARRPAVLPCQQPPHPSSCPSPTLLYSSIPPSHRLSPHPSVSCPSPTPPHSKTPLSILLSTLHPFSFRTRTALACRSNSSSVVLSTPPYHHQPSCETPPPRPLLRLFPFCFRSRTAPACPSSFVPLPLPSWSRLTWLRAASTTRGSVWWCS